MCENCSSGGSNALTKEQIAELSEETQALLKVSFIQNDLRPSNYGVNALMTYLFEQNRAAMVTLAKEKLAQVKN